MLLVLLASAVRTWKQALFIVRPETLLRWHRQGFQLYWKYKSRASLSKPKIAAETVALIKEMARDNRLWGAERIRGELLKLGIHVCKRTIQKYMRNARKPRSRGQSWATFLRNHAGQIWACDFLHVTDLCFRSLFAFFIIELKSRKADLRRGDAISYRRLDCPYRCGRQLPMGRRQSISSVIMTASLDPVRARVANTSGIKMLITPYHTPRANAICERFLGSVRRECLDHLFILQEKQLDRVLHAYVQYFNQARPHQGINQQIPEQSGEPVLPDHDGGKILSFPILGG